MPGIDVALVRVGDVVMGHVAVGIRVGRVVVRDVRMRRVRMRVGVGDVRMRVLMRRVAVGDVAMGRVAVRVRVRRVLVRDVDVRVVAAADDPEERRRLLTEQGKDLERAGKSLLERGYADLASGGYVLMYLPSQAVYESAAAAHPEVIERLLANRVVVAGPATLYALLMNVASLVTEHRALQQADRILAEARELHGRITVFVGHLQAVGTGLARTVSAFNSAVGSWMSRVAPQLVRVGELSGSEEHQPPEPIDEPVRELQMTRY